eukprot:TRINITY_DN47404_c0_g1_i1.p1 TRINITY_DN47404_c0_g1~~TRINITY_DN47404_c0_g1_i1.p1  ORF type:complete len:482 (+),score=2.44 TRINITY_DN47404_c0_g1_i1:89-1534(+)
MLRWHASLLLLALVKMSGGSVDTVQLTTGQYGTGDGFTVVRGTSVSGTLEGDDTYDGLDLTYVLEKLGTGRDVGLFVRLLVVTIGKQNWVEGVTPGYNLRLGVECLCVTCADGVFGQPCPGVDVIYADLPVNTKRHFYIGAKDPTRIFRFSLVLQITGVLAVQDKSTVAVTYVVDTSTVKGCHTTGGEKCSFPYTLNGGVFEGCTTEAVPICYVFDESTPGKMEPCGTCSPNQNESVSAPFAPGFAETISPTPVPSNNTPAPEDLSSISLAMRIVGGLSIIFLGCCIGSGTLLWIDNSRTDDESSRDGAERQAHAAPDNPDAGLFRQINFMTTQFSTAEVHATVASLMDHIKEATEVPPGTTCPVCLESPFSEPPTPIKQSTTNTDPFCDPKEEEECNTQHNEENPRSPTVPTSSAGGEPKAWADMPCKHSIHMSCLKLWLIQRVTKRLQMTCPVCRALLAETVGADIPPVEPDPETGGVA